MPNPPDDHYFTRSPKTESSLRKMFVSVGSQTLSLQTDSGVFSPEEIDKGTKILIESLMVADRGPVLDLGAGYGPICIWLAKEYSLRAQMNPELKLPAIYASEINDRAVFLLKRNLIANQCTGVNVLKGDFLDQVKDIKAQNVRFQAIYTNPPLKMGHSTMLDLFEAAFDLLAPDGFIQYVHKKTLGAPGFLAKLESIRPSWYFKVIRKKAGYHIIVGSPIEFAAPAVESDHLKSYFE